MLDFNPPPTVDDLGVATAKSPTVESPLVTGSTGTTLVWPVGACVVSQVDPISGPLGGRLTQVGKKEPPKSPPESVCFGYTSTFLWFALLWYSACAR